MLIGDDQDLPPDPLQAVQQPDELGNMEIPPFQLPQQPMTAARCINGNLVRPDNTDEEPPSTACRQSTIVATGGVPLGRGPLGHQQSPGGLRGRKGSNGSGGGAPPPPGGQPGGSTPQGNTPPQQTGGAGPPAALHSHLQGYLNPTDIQIHGLHWTDLGSLYRS